MWHERCRWSGGSGEWENRVEERRRLFLHPRDSINSFIQGSKKYMTNAVYVNVAVAVSHISRESPFVPNLALGYHFQEHDNPRPHPSYNVDILVNWDDVLKPYFLPS